MVKVMSKVHKVMEEVVGVLKTKTIKAGSGSYRAVEHDEVTRDLRVSMLKHGLVAIPSVICHNINAAGDGFKAEAVVTIRFTDKESGEYFDATSFAYALDRGDKAAGKAISMATKYVYLKTFMLESFDNEEDRPEEQTISFTSEKATQKQVETLLELLKKGGEQPTDKTITWAKSLTKVQIGERISNLINAPVKNSEVQNG